SIATWQFWYGPVFHSGSSGESRTNSDRRDSRLEGGGGGADLSATRRRSYFTFELSAAANLPRPSRICARDQAANPKVRAGSGSACIKHEDNGEGLKPISLQTAVIRGKSVFRRNQATKCRPASGTSKLKYLPRKLLN